MNEVCADGGFVLRKSEKERKREKINRNFFGNNEAMRWRLEDGRGRYKAMGDTWNDNRGNIVKLMFFQVSIQVPMTARDKLSFIARLCQLVAYF